MKIRHLNPLRPDLFVAGLVLVALACVFSAWACGCSSPAALAAKAADYGARLDACVENAKTLEASQACRRATTLAEGRDAGPAFVRVVAFDNGHPCASDAGGVALDAGRGDAGEGGAP